MYTILWEIQYTSLKKGRQAALIGYGESSICADKTPFYRRSRPCAASSTPPGASYPGGRHPRQVDSMATARWKSAACKPRVTGL